MKLLAKFNLLLLLVFGTGGLIISQVIHSFLLDNANREVLRQAELMTAGATSVRDYTATDIAPLLEKTEEHKKRFLPETVPFFAAMSTFDRLRQQYPDYSYREATLNPTNPEHRATDWEADVIGFLRDHPDRKRVTGERQTAMGPSMYLATPITVEQSCMECHNRPADAPAAMVATYGSNNGFGWKPGSIVAAHIVSVPAAVPLQKAKEAYRMLLTYLVVTLLATMGALDAAVYFIVIRPLKRVSNAADRVSKGETNPQPLPVKGKDEIASVTASFNRMQVSLAKAFKMLQG